MAGRVSALACVGVHTSNGPRCDQSVCSHESPCYPGTCIPPNGCNCDTGFTNPTSLLTDRCLKIQDVKVADLQIFQMQVRMSYWPRNMTPPMEKYAILADSTNLNGAIDFLWSNRRNFNNLQATCSSQFSLSVNYPPPYVNNVTFGIVSANVVVLLTKLPSGSGGSFISLNVTIPCDRQVTSTAPETQLFMCNITNPNFDRVIEHGDTMQVTYKTSGGGFRRLVNLNTNTVLPAQTFYSVESSRSVEFRFDYQPPTHCGETSSCTNGENMLTVSEVTRTNPVKIVWNGWQDSDSKMFRYSMEVFKMTKTSDGKLEIRNDKALDPLINREVMHAALGPQEYTLPGPGMYSVILEAADLGNNTKYVRRLCLFDPDSQITVDSQQRLYVQAANQQTNYTYINNASAPLVVTWPDTSAMLFTKMKLSWALSCHTLYNWKTVSKIFPLALQERTTKGAELWTALETKGA
ncbi:uncharacterized protein LOC112558165 [Pomacea canaliculata]|uniref:uncharacterized protein LOC112558165 n=1 Tax=Pomacea canaliculata TaxID=400727 RepID=UPI000D73543B|nr:uncharacterized protein LOC112558165 [Pomacea canaliculata]